MKLRPYQSRSIDELWQWFGTHPEDDPIFEASVGAGKSLMIAAIAKRVIDESPGARILVLVHQKELLEQNLDKLVKIWPDVDVGIHSASFGKKALFRQVTYATIGSIWKKAHLLGRIDMILADECHLINSKDVGMWRSFINELRRYCPRARVVGFTGTPFRGNGVWLTAGKEALFTAIATRVTMTELLELGFLAPLKSVKTETRIETNDVKTRGEDYIVSDLAKATDKVELVESTCNEIVKLAAGRRRWLVFCVTVDHARHVCDALKARGVMAAVVHGELPKTEREERIEAFRRGTLQCLVNVAVLTTGFDVQEVDFIALLRATKSPVLYTQIAGRGMRVIGADIIESIRRGKADCIWADFTSTTEELGPVDQIKGRAPPTKGSSEAPFRICDNCGSRQHASALVCNECGHHFPEPERIKHDAVASGAAVLGLEVDAKRPTFTVDDVRYELHPATDKAGSEPSLRVEYYSGLRCVAKEFVLLSHDGYGRAKAEAWWERHRVDPTVPIPSNAEQGVEWARAGALCVPYAIQVSLEGKWPEIIHYTWEKPVEPERKSPAAEEQAA